MPSNGLSVVLGPTTGELMADVYARSLVEQLMGEVVTAAEGCMRRSPLRENRTISDGFIQKMLDDTSKMKPYRTSMNIDYDERRPLEIEAIFKNLLDAEQHPGVRLPQVEMLYQQLMIS